MAKSERGLLGQLLEANARFRRIARPERLPVARSPGRFALVTCMDPRINPAALGLVPFGADGSGTSDVRVIRTIGGMAEERSLIVAIHLAGVREIAFVMHTDCGCSLAQQKIGLIAANLEASLPAAAFTAFRDRIGRPFEAKLADHLKTFDDPHVAVRWEVAAVRANPVVPVDTVLHGLVYHLDSARLELVVDGYHDSCGERP